MNPTRRFLFLMDPYQSLNLETETSLLFMQELMDRGQEVFWIERQQLHLRQNRLYGRVAGVISLSPFRLGEASLCDLAGFDVLLNRKDPPYDLAYHHMTLLLDFLPPRVIKLNSPQGLRNLNEKLAALRFADAAPDTLVTADADELLAFLQEKGKVVIKPLQDCSGRGILFLAHHETGLLERVRHILKDQGFRYLMVQEFLPQVTAGDKRIYLAGSEITGCVNRVPRDQESLGNIHMGASCKASLVTERERATIQRILPLLKQEGIFFAGVDFIGERLTEINLTSPSAVVQINQVDGQKWQTRIIDELLRFLDEA